MIGNRSYSLLPMALISAILTRIQTAEACEVRIVENSSEFTLGADVTLFLKHLGQALEILAVTFPFVSTFAFALFATLLNLRRQPSFGG